MTDPQNQVSIKDAEADFEPAVQVQPTQTVTPTKQQIPQAPVTGNVYPGTKGNVWDSAIDVLRPYVGWGGSALGTLAGTPGGPIGMFAGDVGGYAAVDSLMQYLKFEKPHSMSEAMSEGSKQALINAVGGRLFNGLFKGALAYKNSNVPEIYKLFPNSSQALEHFGIKGLPNILKIFEEYGAPKARMEGAGKSGWASFSEALKLSNLMTGGQPQLENAKTSEIYDAIINKLKSGITTNPTAGQFQTPQHYVSNQLFNDLTSATDPFAELRSKVLNEGELEKILSLGQKIGPSSLNTRDELRAFYMRDLFDRATTMQTPTAKGRMAKIDPEVFNEWTDPRNQKALTKLYGAQDKQDLDAFINRVVQVSQRPALEGVPQKFQMLGKGILLGGGAGGILGSVLSGHPIAGGIASLYIPTAIIGRAANSPGFAKALSTAIGAQPATKGTSEVGRALLSGLQGLTIALTDNQGNQHPGKFIKGKDGTYSFQEVQQ